MSETKSRLTCPVCGGAEFEKLFDGAADVDDRMLYAPAVRCVACNLGIEQTIVIPDGVYGTAYDKQRDQGSGSDRWARFHHDRAVAEDRLRQLTPIVGQPNNRLWVDVGCNNGAFLVAARCAGGDVRGVEADEAVVENLKSALGLPAVAYRALSEKSLFCGPAGSKTVFTLFDVLEHVLDPVGMLLRLDYTASPGDYIVVEAPDLDSVIPGETWRHRRISHTFTEHIWHFSAKALRALFTKHLPQFEEVHHATPVPSKLQMVWRKKRDVTKTRPVIGGAPVMGVSEEPLSINYICNQAVYPQASSRYERFTDRARKAMQSANQEAQRFNHAYIGTEHILCGLVKGDSGLAGTVLRSFGVDANEVLLATRGIMVAAPNSEQVTLGRLPHTPRANRTIELAVAAARQLGHGHIGTEHLLLGLLAEQEGIASQVLQNTGVDYVKALGKVRELTTDAEKDIGTDPVMVISETITDVEKIVDMVRELPEEEQTAATEAIRQSDSTFAALVQERLGRINKKAQGD